MRDKGFTLVEMLLVLAIVGILITILLPSVVGVTVEAKEKQAKADLRLIQAALGEYYLKHNDFPPSGTTIWATLLKSMRPRILEKDPEDPFAPETAADTYYQYEYLAPAAAGDIPTYVVWTVGQSHLEDAAVTASDTLETTKDCIYVTNAVIVSASN